MESASRLIGAGPASLTVANDLMPLGYEVVIFEKLAEPGGLMRINIPSFRLPASVLDEEVGYILDMGVDVRYNSPVTSMRALRRRELGRRVRRQRRAQRARISTSPAAPRRAANIHIGIEWLASAHFGHIEKIGKRVLIIGVGNTAMDCCRTSRRLGGNDVKVIARRVASATSRRRRGNWRTPRKRASRSSRITRRSASCSRTESSSASSSSDCAGPRTDGKQKSEVIDTVVIPCDDVILAIGQENAFPWIERDIGIDFDKHGMPVVDKTTMQSHARRRLLRRRRGVGTGEHHLGGRARAPGSDLDPQSLPGRLAHANGPRSG